MIAFDDLILVAFLLVVGAGVEKRAGLSASLSEVLNFGRSMPGTANRTIRADFPIRIKAQGLKSELDAEGRHPALRGHLL